MADSRSRNRSKADIHNHSMGGDSRNSHGDSIVGNKPFRRAYSFSFELAEFQHLELIAASAFDPMALIAISIVPATILGSRKRIVPPGFESFLTQRPDRVECSSRDEKPTENCCPDLLNDECSNFWRGNYGVECARTQRQRLHFEGVKWCQPKLTVRVKHLAGSRMLRHATVRDFGQH